MSTTVHAVPDEPPIRGESWDLQPHDTPRSWEACVVFRDMGTTRDISKVATQLGKSGSLVRRWSAVHDWQARARAYDAWQDQEIQHRLLVSKWRVAERQAQLGRRAQALALEGMAATDAAALTGAEITGLLRAGVAIERDVYFPKESGDVNVNAVAQILIDPILITPPTRQPHPVVDADA